MNDLAHVPTKEQILRLQNEMSKLPQGELTTEHYFSEVGMYCRKLHHPAGMLIVGKTHKEAHFFICVAGEIVAWTETGMRHLHPGDVIESRPGTKRVLMALTDSIQMTVHKTGKTDLDEIERDLIIEEDGAMYDARNMQLSALREAIS